MKRNVFGSNKDGSNLDLVVGRDWGKEKDCGSYNKSSSKSRSNKLRFYHCNEKEYFKDYPHQKKGNERKNQIVKQEKQ